ncbi:MAG: hypothetical protein JXB50_04850 [Spirochaetes bacterium]|nr:hypothetical protein [Spirochaetota bacterium]
MKYILNKKIILLIFIILTLSNTLLPAQSSNINIFVDSVNIRKQFFLDDKNWDLYKNIVIKKIDRGKRFFIITKIDQGNYEILFFAPESNDYTEKYSYGAFSYQFNPEKELLKVKVYYHYKHNSYVFFDKNNPNNADIYLFGKEYKKNIHYYFNFDSLKYISFNSIKALLDINNIREKLLIEEDNSEIKLKFIDKVIKPSLAYNYNDDGARDHFGQFVYIENEKLQKKGKEGLNCSGFIKDIVDNYIRLKEKDFKWLKISDLKKRRIDERQNITYRYKEMEYDTFFGYDWVKNLADEINNYYSYNNLKAQEYDKDTYLNYTRLRGYDVKDLYEILFRDQQKDPSYFYILIFNRLRKQMPILLETSHIAVIVPYFKNNHFYTRVFESTEETNFNNILKYRSEDKVLIIKVPLPLVYL